jgi:co-chaperonin GroES (HSP10)
MRPLKGKLFIELDDSCYTTKSGIYVQSNKWKYEGTIKYVSNESEFIVGDRVKINTHARDKMIEDNLFMVYEEDVLEVNGEPIKDFIIAKLEYESWKYKSIGGILIERRTEHNYLVDGNNLGKHKSDTVCTFATVLNISKEIKDSFVNNGDFIVYLYSAQVIYGEFQYNEQNSCVRIPHKDIICKFIDGNIIMNKGWMLAKKVEHSPSLLLEYKEKKKDYYTIEHCSENNIAQKGDTVIAESMFGISMPDDKDYILLRESDILLTQIMLKQIKN